MYNSGRDYLSKLTDARQLTPDGKEWLTLALDPFHDYNHTVAGYPDADCSQTVVQCYQYQLDLQHPAGQVGNWDAHIYNLPICVGRNYEVTTLDANWQTLSQPNPVQAFPTGMLNIVTNNAGLSLGYSIPGSATQQVTTLPAANNTELAAGITRVIGMGYEVTNTTSELNKQGAVTAYRMPQLGNNYQMVYQQLALRGPITGEMWREAPTNTAEANLLKGTRTWAASEGAYVTCFQNSVHNPMKQFSSSQVVFNRNSRTGAATVVRSTAGVVAPVGGAGNANSASSYSFDPNQTIPFDTTGLFFTGLSETTTLTIKLKVYVERAPTFADADLSVLASPSAGYDVKALELYAAAVNMLPAAVKVGENAKGDWWRAVVGVLKAAAGPIGMALNPFLPGAGLIGAGIQAVSGQLNTSKGKSISEESMKKMTAEMARMAQQVKQIKPPTKPKQQPQNQKPKTKPKKAK